MNNDNILNWFKNRGISAETLRKMSVTNGKEWMPANPSKGVRLPNGGETEVIKFNYLKDGEIVATKLRSFDKQFRRMAATSAFQPLIPYNLDGIKGENTCYITEGEIDALSLVEIGITNVISVPNGPDRYDLRWLCNCFDEYLYDKDTIFICADNDDSGIVFANALARQIGKAHVYVITDYGTRADGTPCKDINDCLTNNGPETLRLKLTSGATQVNNTTSGALGWVTLQCPQCGIQDTLSVNLDTGHCYCHNCGYEGHIEVAMTKTPLIELEDDHKQGIIKLIEKKLNDMGQTEVHPHTLISYICKNDNGKDVVCYDTCTKVRIENNELICTIQDNELETADECPADDLTVNELITIAESLGIE